MKLFPHQQSSADSFQNEKPIWLDWPVLLLLLIAIALRLPWMSQSLWYDEISATRSYLQNIFHLIESCTYDTNMPVHYTLMFFWDKLFKDTEFSVRFPPLIFGLGSLVLIYELARRFFDRRTALLALSLLVISPVHIWYSAEARPYAGIIFFLLLALLAFFKLQESIPQSTKSRFFWFSLYFVAIFLGAFSHLYMVFPILVFSGLSLLGKKGTRLTFLILNGIVLLAFGGLILAKREIFGFIPLGADYLRRFTVWEAWLLFFDWYPTGNTLSPATDGMVTQQQPLSHPGVLLYQIFFAILFVRGLFFTMRQENRQFWGLALTGFLFCIPAFLYLIGVIRFRSTYIERSALVGLPFFLIIVARGVMAKWRSVLSMVLLAGLLFLVGLSTVELFVRTDVCAVGPCKPDYRSAAAYISKDAGNKPEEAAVVMGINARSLTYYNSEFADHIRLQRLTERLPKILKFIQKILGEQPSITEAFRNEIETTQNRLDKLQQNRIEVFSFREISKKDKQLQRKTLYALTNPDNIKVSRALISWPDTHPEYQLTDHKSLHKLEIYKFVRH